MTEMEVVLFQIREARGNISKMMTFEQRLEGCEGVSSV